MSPQPTTETNALAIVSLIFGVLGWTVLPVIGNLVAIVTGHVARGQVRLSGGTEQGDGLALAGLILGYLGLLLGILLLVMFVFGVGILAVLA